MFGTFMKTSVCDKCHGTGEIIKDKCKECSGSGFIHKTQKLKLKIPAGVQNGVTMKLRGEGNDGEKGGISGDLYKFQVEMVAGILERDSIGHT